MPLALMNVRFRGFVRRLNQINGVGCQPAPYRAIEIKKLFALLSTRAGQWAFV
jgi:hypothetical protein